MKTLTIFTPTYNRAYCLHKCYESLVNQKNKDFIWLIIDDGSFDNTKELVKSWINEAKIEIQYYFQENQGMHGAHNTAYRLIETEINTCIDSDDYMADNAVNHIVSFWKKTENKNSIAGFIGLDAYKNGEIIGKEFPKKLKESTLEEIYYKHKINGDKKMVLRSNIVRQYDSYPIFKDERFVPLGILYLLIGKDYKFKCLNEVLCIVEYMEDGSSRNIIKQYYRHPKGFQHARLITLKYSNYFKIRFKNAVHYVSHSIQLKDSKFLKKTPKLFLTIIAIPFGIVLYSYVLYVNKSKK